MIGWILLGLLGLLVAILLLRAACFQPKPQKPLDNTSVTFDREAAVTALQKLVQCKTISYNDPAMEDDGEFKKLIAMLPALYPRVFEICSFRELPDRGILMRWPGKSEKAPSVMMAHYDVVPVNEESWDKR